MSTIRFEELLRKVAPRIKKSNLRRFDIVGPSERLNVTLRYRVTGDSHVTISASYRISPPTVGRIVNETDEDDWKRVCYDFETTWNFPTVLERLTENKSLCRHQQDLEASSLTTRKLIQSFFLQFVTLIICLF